MWEGILYPILLKPFQRQLIPMFIHCGRDTAKSLIQLEAHLRVAVDGVLGVIRNSVGGTPWLTPLTGEVCVTDSRCYARLCGDSLHMQSIFHWYTVLMYMYLQAFYFWVHSQFFHTKIWGSYLLALISPIFTFIHAREIYHLQL